MTILTLGDFIWYGVTLEVNFEYVHISCHFESITKNTLYDNVRQIEGNKFSGRRFYLSHQ